MLFILVKKLRNKKDKRGKGTIPRKELILTVEITELSDPENKPK